MHRIATLFAVLALSVLVTAGTFAQSTANYTFGFANDGSLVDMSSGTTSMLTAATYHDDVASSVTSIGFTFTFMGVNYTQFSVNSNGQLRLGPTIIGGTAQSPAAGVPLIAPMGGDNAIQTDGKIHYRVDGTPGDQILVVEWLSLRIPFSSTLATGSLVQALLYENGGKIEYRYGQVYNNSTSSQSRTIYFSSSNTANTVGYVTVGATPTYTSAASATSNTFAAGPLDVANLSSASDGNRWVYTFTPPAGGAPIAPVNLSFTSVGRLSMTVNWEDNSTNESFFTVSRATAIGGPYTLVGTVTSTTSGGTGTVYNLVQTGLNPTTTYYFRVAAAHEGGASTNLSGSQATDAVAVFSGAYTINPDAPNTGTNFTTWAEAVGLLNTLGVAGPTTFTVTGTAGTITFPEGNLTLGGAYVNGFPQSKLLTTLSSTNTLTFVADAGKTINMSGTGVSGTIDFVFRLQGVDYVTFDGINILDVGGTVTTQFEFGYIIVNASVSDGATNNTIKNFSATLFKTNTGQANGPYGVLVQNGTTLVSSFGVTGSYASRNNNNKIQNFTINGAKRGVSFSGLAIPAFDEGNEVSGPAFTSATGGTWVGGSRITNGGGATGGTDWGVSIDGQKNFKLFNVQIDNFVETSASPALSAIHFGTAAGTAVGADNAEIYNCVLHDFQNNLSTTSGVMGIRSSGTALVTTKIYNTAIYDFRATAATGANVVVGMQLTSTGAGSKFELYNNSIHFTGNLGTGGMPKGMGFGLAGAVIVSKNNAISVTGGGTTGTIAACLDFGGVSPTLIDFSNNLYDVGTTSATKRVANYPSTVRQNLVDWQSVMATPSDGVDQRSGYGAPGFNSATDITYGAANSVNNGGVPISGLSTANDILGVPRSGSTPDIGVFEGNFSGGFVDVSKPGIAITPLEGSVSSEIRVLITDNVTPSMTARLWYRLASTAPAGAFSVFGPDAAPSDSGNGEYRWGASLRTLAAGLYQYYIVVRDAAGNSYADPTMTPGATSPGFTAVGDPNWAGANPFNPGVGVRTFQNAGTTLAAGTYNVGATSAYTSLTQVAADLNTRPLTGNVVFELQPDYTSAGETFPIVFNQPSYTVAGPVTITIRPAASVSSELATAGNPGGSNMLILLDGMRDLILDGRPGGTGSSIMWRIANTKDSAAANASGEAIRLQNDALRNTFKYLKLQANTTTGFGGVLNIAGTFNGGQGNNYNVVDNCDIGPNTAAVLANPPNPVRGIVSSSTATNVYNRNNTYSNNNIHDMHNLASNPIGINLQEVGSTITGNSFYQTAPRSGWTAFGLAIVAGVATGPGLTITNNYIGGSAPLCGGSAMTISATTTAFYAMQLNVGQFTTPTTIYGNTMTNWALTSSNTTANSIVACGINLTTGTNQVPVNVTYNTVGNSSVDATTSPAITFTSASTGAPSVFAGYFASAGGALNIVGNSVGGVKLLTTAAGTSSFIGIQQQTTGIGVRVDSNLIGSLATANNINQNTNAVVTGIAHTVSAGTSMSYNTIANILYDAAVAGTGQTFTGMTGNGTGYVLLIGNTIRDIVGNNHGSLTAISMGTSGLGTVIRGNTIRNFTINPQTPTTAITVQGISQSSSTSSGVVEKNVIHSLVNGSTSTTAALYGLNNQFGTNWTYSNNMVSLGTGSNGDIIVRGIWDFSSPGGVMNFYHNSVSITGSVTAGTINTAAYYNSDGASTSLKNYKNNIFVNTRTGAAGVTRGFAVVHASSSASLPASQDYNVYKTATDTVAQWLGTASANNRTLAGLQALGLDANSIEGVPGFLSATDLHISPGSIVPSNNGTPIATVTDDIDGDVRSGSTPDRGADEYTASGPLAFSLIYPANDATSIPINGSLVWSASQYATDYDVYLGTTDPPALFASAVTDTFKTYTITPLVKHYWKVVANNGVGSLASVVDSFTTAALPPDAPTDLVISDVGSDSLNLTWTDVATNEDGYRVLRSTNIGGPFVQTGSDLPVNTQNFTNTGLTPNTHYYYQVIAFSTLQGNSGPAAADSTTLARTPGAPTFPSRTFTSINVAVTPLDNSASTQFAIQDSATGLYVSAGGTISSAVEVWQTYTAWGGATGKTVTGLAFQTRYAFAVKARNADNVETAFGAQDGTTTAPLETVPFSEGFTGVTFPPTNWVRTGAASLWARLTTPTQPNGVVGPAARANFYSISSGVDSLKTPIFGLDGLSNVALKFSHAYRQYSNETDSLKVIASSDGGATWTAVLFNDGGAGLATLSASTTQFVPSAASNWRGNTVLVPAPYLVNGARFAFVAKTAYGNDLWMDDVQLVELPSVDYTNQTLAQIDGIPNPFRPVVGSGGQDANRPATVEEKLAQSQITAPMPGVQSVGETSVNKSRLLTSYRVIGSSKYEVEGSESVRSGNGGNIIDALTTVDAYAIVTNAGVNSPTYDLDWALAGVPQTPISRPGISFLGRDSVFLSATPLARGTMTVTDSISVAGDANTADNVRVNNRIYVYPTPNIRKRYDNGTTVVTTNIGFNGSNAITAGVRFTAVGDQRIANVDASYRNEGQPDSVTVQIRAAGVDNGTPGTLLYSKKFAGVNYNSAGGDYFTLPLGDDAPAFANGSDYWIQLSFPQTILFPMGAQVRSSGVADTSRSFYWAGLTGSGAGTPLVLSGTGYGWIIRSVGVPVAANFASNPSSLSFGSVLVGQSMTDSVEVSNSGDFALTISSISAPTGYSVLPATPVTVPIGGSETFYVTFAPTSMGAANGNVSFAHNASGSPSLVSVTGTGIAPVFSVNPASVSFGSVLVGDSKIDSVEVTNTGTAPLTISATASDNVDFTVSVSAGPIAPSASEWFYVTFSPLSTGPQTGNVVFTHDAASSPDTVGVDGTGYTVSPTFTVNPPSIAFGNVTVGNSMVDSVEVTNTGTAPLTISATASDNVDFTVSVSAGPIAPSSSEWFYITFTPAATGAQSANIVFTHDAASSPDTVDVTGTGVSETSSKFLTLPPDSIGLNIAVDPGKVKFLKSVKRVKLGKPINPPNWANLLDETVAQGGFQPTASESDDAGGMVIGNSFMYEKNPGDPINPKWTAKKIVGDTAWVRLTKWDFKKSLGKNYADMQKTLLDKTGKHSANTRGLDSTLNPGDAKRKFLKGQLTKLVPAKGKNQLFAELVALKFNIAASQLGKTPVGLGELIYDNDANSFDETTIAGISQQASQMMTYWKQYTPEQFQDLYDAVYAINRAFVGPMDTVSFGTIGGTLVLNGAVDVNDVPFLKPGILAPVRLKPTTTETESGEELDIEDSEWDSMDVPAIAKLYNNYPNPFNPTTTIAFRLREESMVTLKVYNTLGQEVVTLLNREEMEAGVQTAQFVANRLASGIYFYRLQVEGLEAGERTFETGKMMLVK